MQSASLNVYVIRVQHLDNASNRPSSYEIRNHNHSRKHSLTSLFVDAGACTSAVLYAANSLVLYCCGSVTIGL